MKKYLMLIITILLISNECIGEYNLTNDRKDINEAFIVKEKTFEEYFSKDKFDLSLCDEVLGRHGTFYLKDNTKIEYLCCINSDDSIVESIYTKKHPFVKFKKAYYCDTKYLYYIYTTVGEKSIEFKQFDKDGKLTLEKKYLDEKGKLSYKEILQSLSKQEYLDLINVKQMIGENFELSYAKKEDFFIDDSVNKKMPKNIRKKINQSSGVWQVNVLVKESPHISFTRSLFFDDIKGDFLFLINRRNIDTSELPLDMQPR